MNNLETQASSYSVLVENLKIIKELGEKIFIKPSPVYEWQWSKKGKCFSGNVYKMLGYDNPVNCEDIIHPDDRITINNFENKYNQIIRCKHKDGHWVSVVCKGEIIEKDSNGNAIKIVGTCIEI